MDVIIRSNNNSANNMTALIKDVDKVKKTKSSRNPLS